MRVFTDNNIFQLQKFGGISRLFQDYIDSGLIKGKVSLPEVKDKRSLSKRIFKKIGFGVNEKVSTPNILIDNKGLDLFHPSYYKSFDPKTLKTPFVITVYDMIHEIYPEIFNINATSNEKLELLPSARRIIAISEKTKSDLLRYCNINAEIIDVVPLYTKFDKIDSNMDVNLKSKSFILFSGNRSYYKNFKRFIIGCIPILQKHKDILIVCTGPRFSKNELEYFRFLGINERIENFTCKTDPELKWFYENALCFVFPSLYEGFGFPLLEAFASGCPVVSSFSGSLSEVGANACIYFDPMDIPDMTEKIMHVIENQSVKDDLINKGIMRLEKFSLQNTLNLTELTYRKALNQ